MSDIPPPRHWLLKSEPEVYSIDRLEREGSTTWDGVRNYQARNFLKEMRVGDVALFYHSNDDRAVVGLARVSRTALPDPTPDEPDTWVQVGVSFAEKFPSPLTLAEIKAAPELAGLYLVTHSRLSVMPIPPEAFEKIVTRCRSGLATGPSIARESATPGTTVPRSRSKSKGKNP